MQLTPRQCLMQFADLLQASVFGTVEQAVGELSGKAKLLIAVLAAVPPQRYLPTSRGWRGRPAKHRQALATAFLAKAVYGLETTRQLMDRLRSDSQLLKLCGWNRVRQLPHESTFSRAFEEFAHSELPQRLHEALIAKTQHNRLIGHIARDSTAIEARERYPDTPQPLPKKKRYKKGPKAKRNTPRSPRNHIEEQRLMNIKDLLAELPRDCSLGVKKSSKGYLSYWRGYKLHLDVADGDIPITALLTSAKLHDSQAAIAMMNLTSQRVTYLYDLMDAAYDAHAIRNHSVALGHKPIIDPVQRHRTVRTKVPLRKDSRAMKTVFTFEPIYKELSPAEAVRFRQRTSVERVNARLKDHFGGRHIRYRGASKIMAHLMFGLLALTVDQLLKLTG
ncbi:MAG TPA: transposase [Bryobacteraceae bacterium]